MTVHIRRAAPYEADRPIQSSFRPPRRAVL